jgi:CheY-like chemotaxis protein
MPIVPKRCALSHIKEYVEETFRHVAEQHRLDFEVSMEPGLPESIYTDINRLQQILKNLLSNAFKFTSKGGVVMRILQGEADRGVRQVRFSVQDTGIGIPRDKQRLIFEAFQQADGTTSRKYGGTGLGLTISREIARLLGGSIEVQSVAGEGSTFTLSIPEVYSGPESNVREERSQDGADALESATRRLPEDADFKGTKVLLVDDDLRNILAIRTVLEGRGIEVISATNGKAAIDMLEHDPSIDLVLMDTMMPELDGLSATWHIRQTSKRGTLPIISLTAKAMKGDREKAIQSGASDYVTKPVDPNELLAVVHMWRQKAKNPEVGAEA